MSYNGWTNYETWNWKLWIDNDQGSYEYWREVTADCVENAEPRFEWLDKRAEAVNNLADRLQEYCEDSAESVIPESGPFADIFGAALQNINWQEIAITMVDEYLEELNYQEANS